MNNKHLKEFQIEVYLNLINCPAHDQFVSIILIQFQVETCFMTSQRTDLKIILLHICDFFLILLFESTVLVLVVFQALGLCEVLQLPPSTSSLYKMFSYPTYQGCPKYQRKSSRLYPLIPEINKLAPDEEKLSQWSNQISTQEPSIMLDLIQFMVCWDQNVLFLNSTDEFTHNR